MLKVVIGKHQALNSSEILGAAGTVIAKVKGEHPQSAPPHLRINNSELIYKKIDLFHCLCMHSVFLGSSVCMSIVHFIKILNLVLKDILFQYLNALSHIKS